MGQKEKHAFVKVSAKYFTFRDGLTYAKDDRKRDNTPLL